MPTYEWNEAIGGAVFVDDEGRIRLAVLARPSEAVMVEWEAEYPDFPIRQAVADYFPEESAD